MVKSKQDGSALEAMLSALSADLRTTRLTDVERLRELGRTLLTLADLVAPLDEYVRTTAGPHLTSDSRLVVVARALYRARRARSDFFPSAVLGEPSWDILLDLFIHESEKRSVTVSSATIASAVPMTTGLRWVGILVDEGFIERVPLEDDRRKTEVRLTKKGWNAMRSCLGNYLELASL